VHHGPPKTGNSCAPSDVGHRGRRAGAAVQAKNGRGSAGPGVLIRNRSKVTGRPIPKRRGQWRDRRAKRNTVPPAAFDPGCRRRGDCPLTASSVFLPAPSTRAGQVLPAAHDHFRSLFPVRRGAPLDRRRHTAVGFGGPAPRAPKPPIGSGISEAPATVTVRDLPARRRARRGAIQVAHWSIIGLVCRALTTMGSFVGGGVSKIRRGSRPEGIPAALAEEGSPANQRKGCDQADSQAGPGP